MRAAKRAFDVALALTLVVLTSPLLVGLALLIRLTSRGAAVYRQERMGKHGTKFQVAKFRTMRLGAHEELRSNEELLATYMANDWKLPPDDPRITRVGAFLRRTSLDELPQLFNVLSGEMSLVGVRPLLADELARRPAHYQDLYRSMRPGMTGLWQVEGRSSVKDTDRLALDEHYIEKWTFRGDLTLLIRTPLAVFRVHHAH